MTRTKPRTVFTIFVLFMSFALPTTIVAAQTKVEGVIKGRDGAKIILQTADSPKLIVLLTDHTDVAQVQGLLKARKKRMSMAALVPGLPIKVEGSYDAHDQLVAETVRFKGNDLEQAQAIQAGLHETKAQAQQNTEELEKQNAELKKQNEALTEQQKQIDANKAAIAANTARFGQLDDYYIWDEVTILFANGKTKVDPQYVPRLTALAEKAGSVLISI